MPSVIFINRVYPPGNGATGDLLAELAEGLARIGWRVTVVASRPPGIKERRAERNGVRIEWVGGLPFTRRSHLRRALSYLSLYPAFLLRVLRRPRADAVVWLTDPPLVLALGPILRFCKRNQMVHWAQDVYPEVAECLGLLRRGGPTARLLRYLSNWALRRCSHVVAVGECMRRRFVARGVAPTRLSVIPNWAEPGELRSALAKGENLFRVEHGLAGKFVVMYSGNVGLAHTFEAVLDAAEQLRQRAPRIVFLILGEGPRLPWLREQVTTRNLANVRLLPPVPRARLTDSLGAADIHLITMREDLDGLVVPSKLYGVLAAGRPAIFLGPSESEVAKVLLRHQCGSVLPCATGAQLAECLVYWAENGDERLAAASRALQVAGSGGRDPAISAFARVLGGGL